MSGARVDPQEERECGADNSRLLGRARPSHRQRVNRFTVHTLDESAYPIPDLNEIMISSLCLGLCPWLARMRLSRLYRASPSATLWVLADIGSAGLWPLR